MPSRVRRVLGHLAIPASVAGLLVLGTTPFAPSAQGAGGPAQTPLVRLLSLIPADVIAKFPCTTVIGPGAGAIAQISCVGSTASIPAYDVYYYLYSNKTRLSAGYGRYLTQFHVKSGATGCGNFTTFIAGCESDWNTGGKSKTLGHIVEFDYTLSNGQAPPTIAATVTADDLMVQLTSTTANADAMVKWWSAKVANWI